MTAFTPPTRNVPLNDETQGGEAGRFSLWRKYGTPQPVGYSVIIRSGVATPYPGVVSPNMMTQIVGNAEYPNADISYTAADSGSGEGGYAYFRGGIVYEVTSAEETILTTAGYSIGEVGYGEGYGEGGY